MKAQKITPKDWAGIIHEIGPDIASRAAEHDASNTFVAENYKILKAKGLHKAMIPVELGGGGASYREMCDMLRVLASYCGSTGLAFSMHQHLVAAPIWNDKNGNPGRAVLENVVGKDLILISTGGRDWLASNGSMEKVDGGFRVSAEKYFASGCLAGQVAVTSAPYEDPKEGWQVCHFPVPMSSEGVSIREDWDTMGMRARARTPSSLTGCLCPRKPLCCAVPAGSFIRSGMW